MIEDWDSLIKEAQLRVTAWWGAASKNWYDAFGIAGEQNAKTARTAYALLQRAKKDFDGRGVLYAIKHTNDTVGASVNSALSVIGDPPLSWDAPINKTVSDVKDVAAITGAGIGLGVLGYLAFIFLVARK